MINQNDQQLFGASGHQYIWTQTMLHTERNSMDYSVWGFFVWRGWGGEGDEDAGEELTTVSKLGDHDHTRAFNTDIVT